MLSLFSELKICEFLQLVLFLTADNICFIVYISLLLSLRLRIWIIFIWLFPLLCIQLLFIRCRPAVSCLHVGIVWSSRVAEQKGLTLDVNVFYGSAICQICVCGYILFQTWMMTFAQSGLKKKYSNWCIFSNKILLDFDRRPFLKRQGEHRDLLDSRSNHSK